MQQNKCIVHTIIIIKGVNLTYDITQMQIQHKTYETGKETEEEI